MFFLHFRCRGRKFTSKSKSARASHLVSTSCRHTRLVPVTPVNMEGEVQVEGVQYSSSKNMMRQKTYAVLADVKWGHRFAPCVTKPKQSAGQTRPMVAWSSFHQITPLGGTPKQVGPLPWSLVLQKTPSSAPRIEFTHVYTVAQGHPFIGLPYRGEGIS